MFLIALVDELGWLIYTSRILFGVGTGALFTAYFTLAADIVPPSRRTEGIALFGVTGLLPLVVNPIAHESGIEASAIQWFLPMMGGLVLASLLPMLYVDEPSRPPREPTSLRQIADALFASPLWPVWFATFVFSGLVATTMAFGIVAGEQRGIERPAIMWLTYACAAALIRIIGAKLPELVGDSNIVAPALGAYVLGVLCLASADSTSTMALGGALCGLGHGYCFPVLTSQVVSRCSPELRGSALSLFTGLWDITYLFYPPLLGLVSDALGDQVMFMMAASVATLGLIGWLIAEHRLARASGSLKGD
jgi:MFS family permease